MTWIAALPMYNVTPALAQAWRSLLADVLRAVEPTARIVDPGDDLQALWRAPDLLLSQTCGYPLTHGLTDAGVRLVATPEFDVEGCEGARYSSAIVVQAEAAGSLRDGASEGWVEDLRGLRAAFNQGDSHSGMNALRHTVAPYAREGRFFSETLSTGSHLGSLRALADRRADVAAIDCVTMAYVRESLPDLARAVHIPGYAHKAPGLPFIASAKVPAQIIEALRAALAEAVERDTTRAKQLRLRSFFSLAMQDYAEITRMENEARAVHYPHLA